jgi:monofunctional biosynthetic peptidoglycan transglycosylase
MVRRWSLRLVGASAGAVVLYLVAIWLATPPVHLLAADNPRDTAFSRARGQSLGAWTPLEEVSPILACAVVKEDRGFFHHDGFEWSRLRAAVSGGSRVGGSTITQQLAKNLFFGPEPTLHRKLREAFATRALERALSKRRILALYLNVIELGDGVWGIGDGARRLFGVSPPQLGAFEATLLAGLIAAPRAPLQGTNLDRLERVQGELLQQLCFSGLIDQNVWIAADETAPGARPPPATVGPDLASALDSECGLQRQLEMTERFRARFAHR